MRPCAMFDTRKNSSNGICWQGWLYEPCIPLAAKTARVMIVEDRGDYLMVSNYESKGWHDTCKPVGPLYRINRIGQGRPTKNRIELLKTELTARSNWGKEA